MNHKELNLNDVSKLFEFERMSRELDDCENLETLRNICKCYIKLYFKQQETLLDLKI